MPSAMPNRASALASVPPPQKTTSLGRVREPKVDAIARRASSSLVWAARPSVWSELGFAPAYALSSYARWAATDSGLIGVEAA